MIPGVIGLAREYPTRFQFARFRALREHWESPPRRLRKMAHGIRIRLEIGKGSPLACALTYETDTVRDCLAVRFLDETVLTGSGQREGTISRAETEPGPRRE